MSPNSRQCCRESRVTCVSSHRLTSVPVAQQQLQVADASVGSCPKRALKSRKVSCQNYRQRIGSESLAVLEFLASRFSLPAFMQDGTEAEQGRTTVIIHPQPYFISPSRHDTHRLYELEIPEYMAFGFTRIYYLRGFVCCQWSAPWKPRTYPPRMVYFWDTAWMNHLVHKRMHSRRDCFSNRLLPRLVSARDCEMQ